MTPLQLLYGGRGVIAHPGTQRLKGIVAGLLDAYTYQMSRQPGAAQDLLNGEGKIFRRGHNGGEILQLIQIYMIVTF